MTQCKKIPRWVVDQAVFGHILRKEDQLAQYCLDYPKAFPYSINHMISELPIDQKDKDWLFWSIGEVRAKRSTRGENRKKPLMSDAEFYMKVSLALHKIRMKHNAPNVTMRAVISNSYKWGTVLMKRDNNGYHFLYCVPGLPSYTDHRFSINNQTEKSYSIEAFQTEHYLEVIDGGRLYGENGISSITDVGYDLLIKETKRLLEAQRRMRNEVQQKVV